MYISTGIFIAIFCLITELNAVTDEIPPEPGTVRKACSRRGYIAQPLSRVDTTQRVKNLREHMLRQTSVEGEIIHAYIITSDDEHQNEEVAEYDRRLEYISGFSGSYGNAIITTNMSALWTDGRYHLQADDELNCEWLLMKQGRSGIPTQAEWLKHVLEPGSRIGADPKLIPNTNWEYLKKELENRSLYLVEVRKNLVDLIWTKNRPPPLNKKVYVWEDQYAGKKWEEKVLEVREELEGFGVEAMVVTALDEIAWLLNIRGRDIPKSPFVKSYLILSLNEIHFFVKSKRLDADIRDHLHTSPVGKNYSVVIHEYEEIWSSIPTLTQLWRRVLLPSSWVYSPGVSRAIYMTVPVEKAFSNPSPIMSLKAQKNKVEIEGMERASIQDSVALIDFLQFFEEQFYRGEYWDELRVVRVVDQYRFAQKHGRGPSFQTIAAFGSNGAKPHYESSNSTNVQIDDSSTLVLDSGGQYDYGTTDVTRTLHFGSPTEEERESYTKVLMGATDLSSLIFPSNLQISAADIIARAPLWQSGKDYMHGTGHGIGAFLGVHESPISLSYSSTKQLQTFREGNFLSNEPGYYKEGAFGIRLENIMKVVRKYPQFVHYSGEIYLGFEDITLVPYEPKLIDYNMLTIYQRRWLNNYNTKIRILVGAELKRQNKMDAFYWMMEKTKHIPVYSYSTGSKFLPYTTIFTIVSLIIIYFN